MGKLFVGTACLYSDSNFTTKVGQINNYRIGFPEGRIVTVAATDIGLQYNFFTQYLNRGENALLGGTAIYATGTTINQGMDLSLWLPLCTPRYSDFWQGTYYLEIRFNNGFYMRKNAPLGTQGTISWSCYNKYGSLIGTFEGSSTYWEFGGSRPHYGCYIISGLDEDGKFPSDMQMCRCYVNGAWSSTTQQGRIEAVPQTDIDTIIAFFNQIDGYNLNDPYENGGISEPVTPEGTFDFESTDIPVPQLPSVGAYDTGFLTLYNPSAVELKSLANYLWSGGFDLDSFKRIVADPMDAIIGLHIIPIIANHPSTAQATLYVGNISTGLTMAKITEQYYELDCGTVDIPYKWGAYLDYSPYTKLSLYLPYIGFVDISPDDCMDGTIRVVYHVDILSGTCLALVYCTSNHGKDGHVLYTFSGNCACECPVTSGQYQNVLTGSIGAITGVAAGMASGNILGGLQSAANSIISMAKPNISRSGGFGGASGLMGIQYPFLVLTVPHMATPEKQNEYIGYPSFVTKTLGDIRGYAEVEITHLDGITGTNAEETEILQLLEGGVIF